MVDVPLYFEAGDGVGSIRFDRNGKIAGLMLRPGSLAPRVVPVPAPMTGRRRAPWRTAVTIAAAGLIMAASACGSAPSPTGGATAGVRQIPVGVGSPPLKGTLTLPAGNGPFPAVVLVSGSGPNNQDESEGPNHPFLDIALGLAARGIASLRYRQHQPRLPG